MIYDRTVGYGSLFCGASEFWRNGSRGGTGTEFPPFFSLLALVARTQAQGAPRAMTVVILDNLPVALNGKSQVTTDGGRGQSDVVYACLQVRHRVSSESDGVQYSTRRLFPCRLSDSFVPGEINVFHIFPIAR
jgi:hypothetical protein